MIERDYVQQYLDARDKYESLSAELKEAKFQLAMSEKQLATYLEDCGKDSTATYPELGRVTLLEPRIDYCSFDNAYEDEVFRYVEQHGEGPMIKRQIHPSAFRSFIGRMLKAGLPIPACVQYGLRPSLRWSKP